MHQYGADAIAFGHHADDKLETLLTRLANGTGFLGLGGMKLPRGLEWVTGHRVRWNPVFATCDEHGLDYVTDEMNFQSEVTLRNAVRHAFARGSTPDGLGHTSRSNTTENTNERRTPWNPLAFSDGVESLQSLTNGYTSGIGIETENPESAGFTESHVLWTPVYARPGGQLKHAKPGSGADGWVEGWLAPRSPPHEYTNGPEASEIDVLGIPLKSSTVIDSYCPLIHAQYRRKFSSDYELPRANTDSWSPPYENTSDPASSSGRQMKITSRELACAGEHLEVPR
ncbi:hypothetical protein BDM02DRAFT_3128632 [Thelephora ganbajun]|uniref:Uncharacterized protein n=1 Tax=Thelephora ganbajun TaxID=370292 RepID=A0ACB6ZHP8_THEGA|nr:hypothetical protein BDM02DRAFT_3128632 [Thelephora ganbajun]